MNFPYAAFVRLRLILEQTGGLFSQKPVSAPDHALEFPGRWERPERPHPCFGREHGRNKGELKWASAT
jgi:hypothetical protein